MRRPQLALISAQKYCRRSISTTLPPLPPESEWPSLFPTTPRDARDRIYLRNPETASKLANAFLPPPKHTDGGRVDQPKVVIEAFPGPGTLTRALLSLPRSRLSKLIVLEDYEPYLQYLRPLEAHDSRVKIVPIRGYEWDSYKVIENSGLLESVETIPWGARVHPTLRFISHIPHSVMGEQLVAQFFRCMPEQAWLFRYGRVPMSLILGEWVWQRISAPAALSPARCKVSVIAEATADFATAVRPGHTQPYEDHFYPMVSGMHNRRPETRRFGHPHVAINIIPHEHQLIANDMLDKWDFCLRRLFVLKSTPLKKAILSLAPGAASLLKTLADPNLPEEQRVDVRKQIRQLTIADWALIIRAFDNWPFAPQDLGISDGLSTDKKRDY